MTSTLRRAAGLADNLPLNATIALALFLGLLVPLAASAWYQLDFKRQALFEDLGRDHARIAEMLAIAMRTPIWEVRPETGQSYLAVLMSDERVTAASVTAPVMPDFLRAAAPERRRGVALSRTHAVVRGGETIGEVQVEMTTAAAERALAEFRRQILLTSAVQFALGLALLFFLLRLKVLAPIARLVEQSRALAEGRLDRPFDWRRSDEMGVLGQSFEHTRRSLQRLVGDLEQRNATLGQRENELARQTSLLRATLDNMTDGISLVDAELRLQAWNGRLVTLLELPPELVRVGTAAEAIHAYDAARGRYRTPDGADYAQRMRAGFRPGEAHTMTVETHDGRTLLIRRRPIPEGGFVTTYTDISEPIAADRERRRWLQLFRDAVDSIPNGFAIFGRDNALLTCNQAFADFYRTAPAALAGENADVLLPRFLEAVETVDGRPVADVAPRIAAIIADHPSEHIEPVQMRLKDGRWLLVSYHPTREGGLVVLRTDITDIKTAEAEIDRQREALHQAEKMSALGSLLAGVAHELNNPLSVVVGRAIMLEDMGLAEPAAAGVTKIRLAAERCARIVRTFLAMARQQAAARAPVRLEPLVTGSLELLGYGLKSAGIEVVTHIAPDLPPTLADPDQLAQVFNNLIVNAKQALMDWRGPRRIRIEARLDPTGPNLEVRVADTGPGIPADARPRVFDPFFTTKPAGLGTGIGLAVCRGIVEAHGGSIRLDDSERGGAAFVVTLPVGPKERPAGAGAPAGPAPTPGKRILIAEDEPDIGQMLADILSADGHTVTLAANGKEALACLSAQAFDLVISDLIMPELDGPGLYRALAKRDRTLAERILFITGDTLSPTAKRFLSRVKRPVIEKPFLPEDIRRAVDAVAG